MQQKKSFDNIQRGFFMNRRSLWISRFINPCKNQRRIPVWVGLIHNKPQNVLDVGSRRGHGLVEIQNAFLPHPTHIVSLDPHVGSLDTQRRGLAANDLSLPRAFR